MSNLFANKLFSVVLIKTDMLLKYIFLNEILTEDNEQKVIWMSVICPYSGS